MLKSMLAMFGSLGALIIRFMLALGLVFLFGYCVFTIVSVPFLWDGVLRVVGILLSGTAFIWLIGAFRKAEEEGEPRGEDTPRF